MIRTRLNSRNPSALPRRLDNDLVFDIHKETVVTAVSERSQEHLQPGPEIGPLTGLATSPCPSSAGRHPVPALSAEQA